MKYRKKPVVVEAFQWFGGQETQNNCPGWLREALVKPSYEKGSVFLGHIEGIDGMVWAVTTLEGALIINQGSWLVQGVKGELYPVEDEIFRETYEPVE